MEFFRRAKSPAARLGVFPGTFNPPTTAHLELARAAHRELDEVLFVLPRVFPHKTYAGASFAERVAMLESAARSEPWISIATTAQGLFIDIANDCRAEYGPAVKLSFLCGRDAAERIVNWNYGRPDAFADMLEVFDLLVAARDGEYSPPPEFRAHIRTLALPSAFDEVSASAVRRRIARGEPWQHLVPPEVAPMAGKIYVRPV